MTSVSTNWITDDEHAGSLIGLLLGFVFLVVGIVISTVKENGCKVPPWRALTGITLIVLGFISIVIGAVFAAQD